MFDSFFLEVFLGLIVGSMVAATFVVYTRYTRKSSNSPKVNMVVEKQSKEVEKKENVSKPSRKEVVAIATSELRTQMEPTSVLRGFPEVDTLLVSPCQRYLFINCRSKRRARLYPQNTNRTFMERGKELQERHFISVDSALCEAIGEEKKLEICSASFSFNGTRLAIGERSTDTIVVFTIGEKCHLTLLWLCQLPDRRLVFSLPRWGLAGAACELIVMLYDKDCEVEVFNVQNKSFLPKEKFKVGNAIAWAQRDTTITVAGSFLKELRLSTLQLRQNGTGFVLHNNAHIQSDNKVRLTALALVSRNVPEFNTRELLIAFGEDGVGSIYDIEQHTEQSKREMNPKCIGRFEDITAAGWDAARPLGMAVCVFGTAHHERLAIALWRGSDVRVHRQLSSSTDAGLQLKHVLTLSDCHEGDPVERATFIQHGEGLATSGRADGRNVRLWSLPPL